MASDSPRYGRCTILVSVSIMNCAPAMWPLEPWPPEPMLILSGLAFAYATNSGTVFAETDGCTIIRSGERTIRTIGAKSAMKL